MVLTNSGMISTTGAMAEGIATIVDNIEITNSGTIQTTGAHLVNADGVASGAVGIRSLGSNARITHSGTSSTSGSYAHGIYSSGANGVITISGDITVQGDNAVAILGDNGQTLNFLPGFRIFGPIDLDIDDTGDSNTVNFDIGGAKIESSTLTIRDVGVINLPDGIAALQDGELVTITDPTGVAAERIALDATTRQIHATVHRLAPDSAGRHSWGRLFGARVEHDDDDLTSAWDYNLHGVVGGYETVSEDGLRKGLFLGGNQGEVETSVKSIETETNRVFGGIFSTGDYIVITNDEGDIITTTGRGIEASRRGTDAVNPVLYPG